MIKWIYQQDSLHDYRKRVNHVICDFCEICMFPSSGKEPGLTLSESFVDFGGPSLRLSRIKTRIAQRPSYFFGGLSYTKVVSSPAINIHEILAYSLACSASAVIPKSL